MLVRAALSIPLITMGLAACTLVGISEAPEPEVIEAGRLPHKVAILPFANHTSNPEAAGIVRKMFYNFFSSLNYMDLEPALIDDRLKKKGVYQKIISGDHVSVQQLAQFLGVDAIVTGEVLSLGKVYALIYSDTGASLRARMINCESGLSNLVPPAGTGR